MSYNIKLNAKVGAICHALERHDTAPVFAAPWLCTFHNNRTTPSAGLVQTCSSVSRGLSLACFRLSSTWRETYGTDVSIVLQLCSSFNTSQYTIDCRRQLQKYWRGNTDFAEAQQNTKWILVQMMHREIYSVIMQRTEWVRAQAHK
jgi:hypothetical protein